MLTHTDHEAAVGAHEQRLAALDPLLPHAHPLPEPGPDDTVLTSAGGAGIARCERPDPSSLDATWGAAHQHRLVPRVGGPDPTAAMATLLDRWHEQVATQAAPGGPDSEASLTWPSRDVAMTELFLSHGLVPKAVVAARPAGRAEAGDGDDVRVRPLEPDDLDAAVALWLEVVRWDAQFNTITERPSTAEALRRELLDELGRDQRWSWVAERDRQVCGLLTISPPERAGWIAPLTSTAPAAYLGCLGVTAGHRGGGAGAALVRHGHRVLDAAGAGVTLLHYAGLNPLSGPFWHRHGYRPLWTIWSVWPAVRLQDAPTER